MRLKGITVDGKRMSRKEAAQRFGCSIELVRLRILARGYSLRSSDLEKRKPGRKLIQVTKQESRRLAAIPGPTKWEMELWGYE